MLSALRFTVLALGLVLGSQARVLYKDLSDPSTGIRGYAVSFTISNTGSTAPPGIEAFLQWLSHVTDSEPLPALGHVEPWAEEPETVAAGVSDDEAGDGDDSGSWTITSDGGYEEEYLEEDTDEFWPLGGEDVDYFGASERADVWEDRLLAEQEEDCHDVEGVGVVCGRAHETQPLVSYQSEPLPLPTQPMPIRYPCPHALAAARAAAVTPYDDVQRGMALGMVSASASLPGAGHYEGMRPIVITSQGPMRGYDQESMQNGRVVAPAQFGVSPCMLKLWAVMMMLVAVLASLLVRRGRDASAAEASHDSVHEKLLKGDAEAPAGHKVVVAKDACTGTAGAGLQV